jgi:hypothetical protein
MFQEKQRFTQWWLWAILIGISAVATFGIYQQIITGEPFGDNPMSDAGLITFAISMYSLPVLFRLIRIDTEIDNEHIKFNFVPFLKKSVAWSDVKSARVLDYGTVGGWGIKHSSKYGTVYATSGDIGLAIEMKSGSKFVIGTQNEDELKSFLEK